MSLEDFSNKGSQAIIDLLIEIRIWVARNRGKTDSEYLKEQQRVIETLENLIEDICQ